MATTRTAKKTTPPQRDAAAKKTAPAPGKAPAKKTAARKPAAKKTTAVSPSDRKRNWMTDAQGYAVLAARIAGINTTRIQDWVDHHDGTVTRALADGTLHYTVSTRTLRWQATCRMGAIHEYRIDDPSMAAMARVRAATCPLLHADLSTIKGLTDEELAELGIHTGITFDKQIPGEDPITETVPIPLPGRERALGDALTHATSATDDTQPIPVLPARADDEHPMEHPEP